MSVVDRPVEDPAVPDAHVHGYSAEGQLVCVITYKPFYYQVDLADGEVTEWRIAPGSQRYIKILSWWRQMGYHTEGRA
jgi:hypothetical protein